MLSGPSPLTRATRGRTITWASICNGKGTTRGAVEAYRQSIVLKPDFAEAFNNYGNTLTALGRFDRAHSRRLTKSLALRPRYARAHYNRGCLLDQSASV